MEKLIYGLIGILLLIGALQDIRAKRIHLWIILTGGLTLCVCILFSHNISLTDRVGGLSVGLFVILVSKITGGKIGMGDGFLLCVTGIGLGFWGNLELFALALFAAAVLSVFLLLFKKADRKKCIPFVPFLLLAYLFFLFLPRQA